MGVSTILSNFDFALMALQALAETKFNLGAHRGICACHQGSCPSCNFGVFKDG